MSLSEEFLDLYQNNRFKLIKIKYNTRHVNKIAYDYRLSSSYTILFFQET